VITIHQRHRQTTCHGN